MVIGKIVVPGEPIMDKPVRLENTYIKDGKTYTMVVGMSNGEKFTALESVYTPKIGDTIIGIVTSKLSWGYSLDLNLPQKGAISSRDSRLRFNIGDLVAGKVKGSGNFGDITLNNVKKLSQGKIFIVSTSKIPRIIGRKSSMIDLIKKGSNTYIIVGNNGYIWVSSQGNIPLIKKVLDEVVSNAHNTGLTDRISKFIKQRNIFINMNLL